MNKSIDTTVGKDGKKSFTIRESTDDDTSKTVTVKECENGYYITIEKSYYENDSDGSKKYKWDSKSYISTENPLEAKKKEVTSTDIIDSVSSYVQKFFNKFTI